jgi:ribosomal protein S27E
MQKKVSLIVKCPKCRHLLMDDSHLINNRKAIRLIVQLPEGKQGSIWLSSIYGDYNYTSDFSIPEGEVVDFICPHCHESLARPIKCEICGAPIVSFTCSIGGRVSICSRNGCKNHYVVFENLDTAIRKFYTEYGY